MRGVLYLKFSLCSTLIFSILLSYANYVIFPSLEDKAIGRYLYSFEKEINIGINDLIMLKSSYNCPLGYEQIALSEFPKLNPLLSKCNSNLDKPTNDTNKNSKICMHNILPTSSIYNWKGHKFCQRRTSEIAISISDLNITRNVTDESSNSDYTLSISTNAKEYFLNGIIVSIGKKCVNPYEKGVNYSSLTFLENSDSYNDCSSVFQGLRFDLNARVLDESTTNLLFEDNSEGGFYNFSYYRNEKVYLYASYLPSCLRTYHGEEPTFDSVFTIIHSLQISIFSFLIIIATYVVLLEVFFNKFQIRLKTLNLVLIILSFTLFLLSVIHYLYIKSVMPLGDIRSVSDMNYDCYDLSIKGMIFFSDKRFEVYNLLGIVNTILTFIIFTLSFFHVYIKATVVYFNTNWYAFDDDQINNQLLR